MTTLRRPTWLRRLTGRDATPRRELRDTGTPGDTAWPLDMTRIEEYLASKDFRFVRDADGDVTGNWDDNRFWFMLLGGRQEIVQVRGRWDKPIPLADRSLALHVVNDWNRERIWPKVYLRTEDESLALYCEVSADFSAGATDAQLAQLLACGLGTGVQFFATVEGHLSEGLPPAPLEPGGLD
jgi:hypothetical protein